MSMNEVEKKEIADAQRAAAAASRHEWFNRVNGYPVNTRLEYPPQDPRTLKDRDAFVKDQVKRGQMPPGSR
jgi:hypothetical protein